MNSKQVVLITGSSTDFGRLFADTLVRAMVEANAPFKFLARLVLAITLAGVAAKANAQSTNSTRQPKRKARCP